MAKILMLSDSPFTCTGYATISTNIMNGLSDLGHQCFFQAHNYIGQTLPPGVKFEDGKELKFTIYGTGKEPYSKDVLIPRLRELKPDIFIVLLDTFMLYQAGFINLDFAPAKTIFYFPSDGEDRLPLRCEDLLRKFHVPVAMAKFGQEQVLKAHGIKAEYIPHAVDTKIYYPLPQEEREKLKAKYGFRGKFVIGSVYRNQGRKMPDRMFKAFAKFAKNNPDAILFCHSDPFDSAAVFDSHQLIKKLGIENRVRFSGMNFFKGFDYKQMNEIYNVMDVFTLSTSGEGFGVPIIEASSCGIPNVVTDYTTTKELLIDNGVCGLAVPICTDLTGSWNVERGVVDIDKLVEAYQMMKDNPAMRKEMGKIGVEKVKKYYNWDMVIKDWDKLIRRMTE